MDMIWIFLDKINIVFAHTHIAFLVVITFETVPNNNQITIFIGIVAECGTLQVHRYTKKYSMNQQVVQTY